MYNLCWLKYNGKYTEDGDGMGVKGKQEVEIVKIQYRFTDTQYTATNTIVSKMAAHGKLAN